MTLPANFHPARESPDELRFTVPGEPVPSQMRTVLPGGGVAYSKQVERSHQYRDHVRLRAMMAINASGWRAGSDQTFALEARVFLGNKRTFDLDNAMKALGDSLKGTVFPDDRQVFEMHAWKVQDAERPRVEIVVRRLPSSSDRA